MKENTEKRSENLLLERGGVFRAPFEETTCPNSKRKNAGNLGIGDNDLSPRDCMDSLRMDLKARGIQLVER